MILSKSVIARNFDNIHVVGQPIYKFQNYHMIAYTIIAIYKGMIWLFTTNKVMTMLFKDLTTRLL